MESTPGDIFVEKNAEFVTDESIDDVGGWHLHDLLSALVLLDRLLGRAIEKAQRVHGSEAAGDPFRGLYISPEEATRLLAHEPGAPLLYAGVSGEPKPGVESFDSTDESRLAWLAQAFGLSAFDLDLILIALAPELDRRYERLFAFLQDDVRLRRPTVDLALNLLCSDAVDKLERRMHFDADAPLIHQGLIHLIPDAEPVQSSLLSQTIKLDEQILRYLLHQDALDARLTAYCEVTFPSAALNELPIADTMKENLPMLIERAWETDQPLTLYFRGQDGAGKRQAAAALAAEIGSALLVVDLPRAYSTSIPFEQALKLALRYAWLYDLIPYLEGVDLFSSDEDTHPSERLTEALASQTGITILAGKQPWRAIGSYPLGVVSISFNALTFAQQRACWQSNLAEYGLDLDEADLSLLASRYRLLPGQIAEVVAVAVGSTASPPTLDELLAAARAQCGHDLARLTRRIDPVHTWDDIVLPEDTIAQLREICQRVNRRHLVLDEWGFEARLSLGKGVTALFAGPSGTGKTMAAEIVAGELGLDLYKIDLAGVVSKYIGETERNLERIFRAAQDGANAVLFFDEADALFGKRSEVRDSHDRYANIEISYLLQKMEEYEGLAILATNLIQNMDAAFMRRLAFSVHFPFPDAESRQRIWKRIWPSETPLTQDVDAASLAQRFEFSGGNIKNVALAAAFLAAEDGKVVTLDHVFHATRREYQKMGQSMPAVEDGVEEAI